MYQTGPYSYALRAGESEHKSKFLLGLERFCQHIFVLLVCVCVCARVCTCGARACAFVCVCVCVCVWDYVFKHWGV